MDIVNREKPAYGSIRPRDLAALHPRPRVIDVRQPEEFAGELGRLPGAELVPLATIQERARQWSKDEALLVVCRSGARSAQAAGILAQMGFGRVINLEGGMLQVNAEHLPVER